jgi:hypothetical protein
MAENNKCIDVSTLQEIEDTYKNLKKENLDWLEYFLPEYTKKAYEYDNIVKDDDC